MPRIPWTRFRTEVISLYTPPLRAKTTEWKIRHILRLVEGLGVKSTSDLTPDLIARFLRSDPDWRPATVKGHLGYLRSICTYAHTMQYVRVNPFAARKDWLRGFEFSAEEDDGPDHLSLGQVADLLTAAEARADTWRGARAHAMVCLVAYTGLRKMEALTRAVADFDLETRIVRIRPRKGRRLKTSASAQPVPIPAALEDVLRTWLPRTGSEWAFPGTRGNVPWTSGYTGGRPLDALKAIGQEAGVPHVNFQMLRHSWATHAEHWGLGELMVQRVLRHTTTRTQRHYRHADLINLAAAVRDISFGPATRTG
jgi:integrase